MCQSKLKWSLFVGAEGFTTEEDQEMLNRIEKQIKRRFVIGSQVSEHAIVQDFSKQKYPERAIYKVTPRPHRARKRNVASA